MEIKMNIKNLKIAIIITLIALPCLAVKFYRNLNMTGQNITNVPFPIEDSHAVNNEYINQLVDELYGGTNLSVAVPAKCADGQIAEYTPIPGEDLYENMQYGVPWDTDMRFKDNGDGTVTDDLTGLMWTTNANPNGSECNWNTAINYCETYDYAGHSDWRLPNKNELFSLIDFSQFNPALPDGHPFSAVQASYYWSSSSYAGGSGNAWYVHMNYGLVSIDGKTYSYYVWPVRAGR